jgi:hypothetical protein
MFRAEIGADQGEHIVKNLQAQLATDHPHIQHPYLTQLHKWN